MISDSAISGGAIYSLYVVVKSYFYMIFFQVNDSSLLPNMPDMSLSQSYAQRGEISPGLPCRLIFETETVYNLHACSKYHVFHPLSS